MHSPLYLEDVLHDGAREEDFLEVPLSDAVFKIFFGGVLFLIGIMFFRLVYLNVFQHSFFVSRALMNISDVKIEHAPRGIIYDRYGKILLDNAPSFEVALIPKLLPREFEERHRVLERVATILEEPIVNITEKIEAHDWGIRDRLVLANDITQDQLIAFSASYIPGVVIESSFKRVHNNPTVFSHVVGYTSLVNDKDLKRDTNLIFDDVIGKAGLELYYNEFLQGINGKRVTIRNSHGKEEDQIAVVPPKLGKSLHTFIDKELQEYMVTRMKEMLITLGRNVAVGIVINPQNGEVLALANIPGYDIAHVGNALRAPFQPLFNRAVSGRYNPGSTIKPLVATAALVENIVTPETNIFSKGFIEIPNPYNPSHPSKFVDWKPHGWVNLASALARSSNIYFYEIGGGFERQRGLGIIKLKEWWGKFGLGEKTGIDLPEENVGFLPDPAWKEEVKKTPWRIGDTYHATIGQGDFSVTPIALVNYIAAIANGGMFYTPQIMNFIEDGEGVKVQQSTTTLRQDIRSYIRDAVFEVQKGMRDAVDKPYGTAYLLHNLPFPVAGKTGTAQIENNTKTNAFFVGYAPFEKPQIALLILIEDAREGSLNTVPVAKDIFLWYYEHRIKASQ